MLGKLVLTIILLSLGTGYGINVPKPYWISFSGFVPPAERAGNALRYPSPAGPKYVMKIDDLGNVLIPAHGIKEPSFYKNPLGGATTILDDGHVLHIWVTSINGNRQFYLFHIRLDKSTLRLLHFNKTRVQTNDQSVLQVTQKLERDFLVYERFQLPISDQVVRYLGLPIAASGAFLTGAVDLLPEGTLYPGIIGVSSDGRIFLRQDVHFKSGIGEDYTLLLQRLDESGRPVGTSVPMVKGTSLLPIDVTDSLPGSKRYVLYGTNSGLLRLQVVDSAALTSEGPAIGLGHRNLASGSVVIDPRGHFIIEMTCCQGGLAYQALDALGHKSGTPRLISHVAAGGIDIAPVR
jgi:hypothetical protein